MTFLELVCCTFMGPPTRSLGNGQSHWPCPVCGGDTFNTFPHRPEYKDRFKCWRLNNCGFRGDELDLVRLFVIQEQPGDDLRRLERLRDEYEQSEAAIKPAASTFIAGAGSSVREVHDALFRRLARERDAVDEMVKDMDDDKRAYALHLAKQMREIARWRGMSMNELLEAWETLHLNTVQARAADAERVAELERFRHKLAARAGCGNG
jgi:hypothetical protein